MVVKHKFCKGRNVDGGACARPAIINGLCIRHFWKSKSSEEVLVESGGV